MLAGAFCAVVFYIPSAERSLIEGAYGKEDTSEGPIIWTAPRARFALCPGGASELPVEFRVFHPEIESRPVHVYFALDAEGDTSKTTVAVSSTDWQQSVLKLPPGSHQKIWLNIRTSRAWSPAAAGLSADSRWFGVMLKYRLPFCER